MDRQRTPKVPSLFCNNFTPVKAFYDMREVFNAGFDIIMIEGDIPGNLFLEADSE